MIRKVVGSKDNLFFLIFSFEKDDWVIDGLEFFLTYF